MGCRPDNIKACLEDLSAEFQHLDNHELTETIFLIFPDHFAGFNEFLAVAEDADQFLVKENYEGIYQLASFHPLYLFEGSPVDDAANYTNRSPFPMLHILREDSITKVLKGFDHPENIPDNNIDFTRKKGLKYMELLLAACMG